MTSEREAALMRVVDVARAVRDKLKACTGRSISDAVCSSVTMLNAVLNSPPVAAGSEVDDSSTFDAKAVKFLSDPLMERKAAAWDALAEACQRGGLIDGQTPEGHIADHLLDKVIENKRLRSENAAMREALAIDPRERLPMKGEVYKVPNESVAYFVTGTVSGAHSRTVVNFDVRSGVTNERFLAQEVWPLDRWRDWICDKGRLIGSVALTPPAARESAGAVAKLVEAAAVDLFGPTRVATNDKTDINAARLLACTAITARDAAHDARVKELEREVEVVKSSTLDAWNKENKRANDAEATIASQAAEIEKLRTRLDEAAETRRTQTNAIAEDRARIAEQEKEIYVLREQLHMSNEDRNGLRVKLAAAGKGVDVSDPLLPVRQVAITLLQSRCYGMGMPDDHFMFPGDRYRECEALFDLGLAEHHPNGLRTQQIEHPTMTGEGSSKKSHMYRLTSDGKRYAERWLAALTPPAAKEKNDGN